MPGRARRRLTSPSTCQEPTSRSPSWASLLDTPSLLTVRQHVVFHSHTSASHDGRPGFTAAANRAWHGAAGFDVAYITDHNRLDAADSATRRAGPGDDDVLVLPGVEFTRDGEHVVSLGVDGRVARGPTGVPVVIRTIPEPRCRGPRS